MKAQPVDGIPRAAARRPRQAGDARRRKTTSSTSCSSPTRTTPSCASPTAAACTGSRSTRCRRRSRGSRGKPIVNMLPLEEGEKINAVLPRRRSFADDHYVFMATARARSRRRRSRSSRGRARPASSPSTSTRDDRLIGAALTDGKHDVMLFASARQGGALRRERRAPDGPHRARRARHEARRPGRRGHRAAHRRARGRSLTATENGYGKRTPVEDTRHGRGSQGVIGIQTSERNGRLVGALQVAPDDEIMLITRPARSCARRSPRSRRWAATRKACA